MESWAAQNKRGVEFSYTLPTNDNGPDSGGQALPEDAVADRTRIDTVDIMTFDYSIGTTREMAKDTETAAQGLVSRLRTLYPNKTAAQLWATVGVTEMPGIDDYGKAETLTTADARTVDNWAVGKGAGEISTWASERDNGGCPGHRGLRQLLRPLPAGLVLQPHLGALHQLSTRHAVRRADSPFEGGRLRMTRGAPAGGQGGPTPYEAVTLR